VCSRGHNPDLSPPNYEDLFAFMKVNFPLAIHGPFRPRMSLILRARRLAGEGPCWSAWGRGLDSVPGGAARSWTTKSAAQSRPRMLCWHLVIVMREAHGQGLRTSATMVFGFGESPRHWRDTWIGSAAACKSTAGFTASSLELPGRGAAPALQTTLAPSA